MSIFHFGPQNQICTSF